MCFVHTAVQQITSPYGPVSGHGHQSIPFHQRQRFERGVTRVFLTARPCILNLVFKSGGGGTASMNPTTVETGNSMRHATSMTIPFPWWKTMKPRWKSALSRRPSPSQTRTHGRCRMRKRVPGCCCFLKEHSTPRRLSRTECRSFGVRGPCPMSARPSVISPLTTRSPPAGLAVNHCSPVTA